jgi:hypothetical protein
MNAQQIITILKPDYFRNSRTATLGFNAAERSDCSRKPATFDHMTIKPSYPARHPYMVMLGMC